MTFDEVLDQVRELLQSKGRMAYRALKRRFALDDEYLEDLKAELIDAEHVAHDEDGKVLVWTGGTPKGETAKGEKGETEKPPTSSDASPQGARREAERRQLTVMFCDLVGSTALSERLDPEELREVVSAYHETCAGAISRYAGHTAQHLGDGLLVYFGYPVAHEDDAPRAVRTSLEILSALASLNAQLPPTIRARLPHPVQVRIGVHTGLVVIGEIGSSEKREILALGETPNIAARLQGLAEPDTVVISGATYRLVQGLFECQNRDPQELKGISTPFPLYRVVRESEAQSRFEVAVTTGLTPLVGREEEVGLLWQRWERVKEGAGQVVLLSGEPGIGKSRLVQVLKGRVAQEGYTRIEFRCSPYYQNTAFYPVIEHVQRFLQFRRDDTPEEKLSKLERALESYRFDLKEIVPFLAALLSLPALRFPLPVLTPQKQKQKTQEALVAWLLKEAERQAVLAAWEDLHWADPSTLELLDLLINQAPTVRIYMLLTFRPEFTPPWASHSHLTLLTLSRLPRPQAEVMVTRVTGGKALPMEVVQQIVAKTDGVPLFVEELTKTVLESGLVRATNGHYELTGLLPLLAIPATLQDSLMARLDRLATVKEVAQLGATLGREFSYELLRAVSPRDEATLQRELAQLVDAEFLFQRGLPPQAQYLFKHALIQDTAYQSLLKSKRQQYHQQIAKVLAERFPETTETQPELLAHHYTEAGLIGQAISYWQKAGQRAIGRSALVEGVTHLTKGLELLKTLPDTPEHAQQELTLLITLGLPLWNTKGYGAPEVGQAFARARELCQQIGETPQLFMAIQGLCGFYIVRAEYRTARELAEQCLTLAQRVQDPVMLLWAHPMLANVLFYFGELTQTRAHGEQGLALYDPRQHRSVAFSTGHDLGVHCLSYALATLWLLGYPDQALKRNSENLGLAQELALPSVMAFALYWAVWLHHAHQEGQAAQEQAGVLIALAREHGFPWFLAAGTILCGWALAEQGQGEEGIAQIRQGLTAYRAQGAEQQRTLFLALLAEACGKAGHTEEGLAALAEALTMVDHTGECVYEAELYRLKGELLLQSSVQGLASEAEACFLTAIEIARQQQAKSLELRAVMSLARLWQQSKRNEARQMLAEIYGWFTEGFDTKDLQEAKRLIEELS